MKKILAVIMVLLLLVSILVGCSLAEIGFYNTVKGMMSLQNFSFSGAISVNIDTLTVNPENELGIDIPEEVIESIKSRLASSQIIYDGTVNKQSSALTFNLKEKPLEGDVNNIFNLMLDKEKIALNKDMADQILFSVPGGTPITVNGIDYIQYDLAELISYFEPIVSEPPPFIPDNPYPEGSTDYDDYEFGYFTGYFDGLDNLDDRASYDDSASTDPTIYEAGYDDGYAAGLSDADDTSSPLFNSLSPVLQSLGGGNPVPSSLTGKINKLFDDFINITMSGLSFNNITQIGDNSYQLSLKNGEIADMLFSTLKYILSNPGKLSNLLLGEDMQSGFIGSLTQDEIDSVFGPTLGVLSVFGDSGPPIFTKQDLQFAVSNMLSEFPTGPDLSAATDELDSQLASFKDQINSMFDYTSINTLSKLGAQSYGLGSVFTFETKDSSLPINAKLSITMTSTVKGIKLVPVDTKDDVPDTGCSHK